MTSIHLTRFPTPTNLPADAALVADMDRVRDACNAALSIRNTENIRIRQPLQRLTIVGKGAKRLEAFFPLIQDEVNVKEIMLAEDISAHASYNLKINFPILGKRLPEKMKQLIPASKKGEWEQLPDGRVKMLDEVLEKNECELLLQPKAPKGAQALSTNDALVVLDLAISEDLRLEGIARDIVRLIQQSRKDAGLNVSDRINLVIASSNADVNAAVTQFSEGKDYAIAEQTLAHSITLGNAESCPHHFTHNQEGAEIGIGFSVKAEATAQRA